MNNNGKNETVNDETTSENSMTPQTSQKVGRKKVLMNENERPHEKKSTRELSVMAINKYTKLRDESTCCFMIDTRNLTNVDPSS